MFFVLSKVLWLVTQPSNVLLMLIVAGTALLFTQRFQVAGRRLLVAAIVGLLVMGYSPLTQALLAQLEDRFPRADLDKGLPVTGIILLGGAEDGRAGPSKELAGLNESAERVTEGAVLGLRFKSAKVVFSGGDGHLLVTRPGEALAIGRLLQALGIEKERLILEDKSRNTWENATFTKAMIDPKPGERWVLVTSAFHMARSVGCFRKAGIPVDAWPVDYRVGPRLGFEDNYIQGIRQMDFIIREYIGLLAYYLSGKTTALFPR